MITAAGYGGGTGQLYRLPPFRDFRGAPWLACGFDVPPEFSGSTTFKLKLGTIHNTATI